MSTVTFSQRPNVIAFSGAKKQRRLVGSILRAYMHMSLGIYFEVYRHDTYCTHLASLCQSAPVEEKMQVAFRVALLDINNRDDFNAVDVL